MILRIPLIGTPFRLLEHGDRGLVAAAATPAQDGKVRVKPIHGRGSRCVANDRPAEVQVDSQTPAPVLAERVGLSESAVLRRRGRQFYNVKDI